MNYEHIYSQNLRLSRNQRSGAEVYSYLPQEEHSHYRNMQMPVAPSYHAHEGGISSNTYPVTYGYNNIGYTEPSTKAYPDSTYYRLCCNNELAFSSKTLKRKYNNGPGADDKLVENNANIGGEKFQGRDSSYPEALNNLIHALLCELCNVKLNSLISARDHYESKVHDRNVTAWLRKNYTEKGLEAPVVKRFVKYGTSVGPSAYYCQPCDVKLTSLTHANQHYAGRKHRMAISKLNSPDTIPTANPEEVHYQEGSAISTHNTNPTIYTGFYGAKAEEYENANIINGKQIPMDTVGENHMLYCATCNVNVTSALQMTMHLAGIKHKKKLLKTDHNCHLAIAKKEPIENHTAAETLEITNHNLKSIPTVLTTNPISKINTDTTMYRTPSGQYYCKVCNTTMSNVPSLHQHLLGKRHQKAQVEESAKACINNTRFMN